MSTSTPETSMPLLATRDEYIDFLEGESSAAEPTGARLRKNLVKSYVIETVRDRSKAPDPAETFAAAAGLVAEKLDDGALHRLRNGSGEVVALMEGTDTRFPVIHSTLLTTPIDAIVMRAVSASPWLDHVWLPGKFFDSLWQWTRTTADSGRLAKLKFGYTAFYERLSGGIVGDDDLAGGLDDDDVDADGDDDDRHDDSITEVRRSHFEVEDRVGVLDQRLSQLRSIYNPLQSTVRIKIPSGVAGGHEVYHYGKITNRSVSFAEQQKIVRLVTSMYKEVTEDAEDMLWYGTEEAPEDGAGFSGRPVLLEFGEPLELATLHTWADRTFGSRRNRFRLGGQPMWSGPNRTRLHVYGIDRHLWQPLSLEATRNHLLVVLPRGTCGNTINRLVTNVQHSLAPSVTTWIGEMPYAEMLGLTSKAS